MRGPINGLSPGENDIIRRNLTTPTTDTTTPEPLTCPRCGSDDLTRDHAAHYSCESCGGFTTTPDTALAVIERHLSEWEGKHQRCRQLANDIAEAQCSTAIAALALLRDELRDTPSPDAWNAATSPFDPVRAGMAQAGYLQFKSPHENEDRCGLHLVYDGDDMLFAIWRPVAMEYVDVRVPITMPDGAPRTHADVISILRANGWGGDDE
jgi:ribosomal protein S27AE